MFLLIILFLFSNLWGAADQLNQLSLTHNRRWAKITKEEASVIYPCTEKLPQKKKDQNLLEEIGLHSLHSNDEYNQQRIYIAALVYAEANVFKVQQTEKMLSLLHYIAKFDDVPLARLLLKHNADVNEEESGRTAIFNALTASFAKVLINHKGFKHPDKEQKIELMGQAMLPEYAPELITLYQERLECDPTSSDSLGCTPLIHLAHWPQKYMIKKTVLLFANLSHKQIRKQIAHKNSDDKTVLKIVKAKMEELKKDPHFGQELDQLKSFNSFLRRIAKRNYGQLNSLLQAKEVREHSTSNCYDDSEIEDEVLDEFF